MRRTIPLGELVTIKSGFSPSTLELDANGAIPFVKVEDLNNCEIFQEDSRFYTNDATKSVPAGAVIFPKRGAAIMNNKVRITKRPICMDTNMMALIPNGEIEADYLYRVILTEGLYKIADTSSIPQINNKHINPYRISLPTLPEQRQISATFRTWDRAIETVEALIANARAQKQALMQRLLTGKRRLPGFDLPWNERALESIFQFKKGQGLSKGAVIPEGVRPCILYGELYTRYPEVIREVVSRTNANDGFPSKSGDVLIPASTTTTGIDLANATAILESDVLLSGDINILRPKNTKQSAPFFAYLLTHILKHKIASRAQGITIVHLYGAHLKPLTVTFPDVEEQHAIASIILDADDEILRLEAQLTALRQEKAALMQQLLTGKRKVKFPESEVTHA